MEIPIGTNHAPLVADLFLFCYERDFIMSLLFLMIHKLVLLKFLTSKYLNELLNIDNPYFEGRVTQNSQ